MKIKSLLLTSVLALTTSSFAQDKAEELFTQKCSICHFKKVPEDKSTVIAPPAPGLMFHMNELFSTNKEIKSHMASFSLNPTKESAKLKGAVKRFGLMPSQKDLISEEELTQVVEYMIHNFGMTAAEHDMNQKKHSQN